MRAAVISVCACLLVVLLVDVAATVHTRFVAGRACGVSAQSVEQFDRCYELVTGVRR